MDRGRRFGRSTARSCFLDSSRTCCDSLHLQQDRSTIFSRLGMYSFVHFQTNALLVYASNVQRLRCDDVSLLFHHGVHIEQQEDVEMARRMCVLQSCSEY